jgi:rod shape determining protein RodA
VIQVIGGIIAGSYLITYLISLTDWVTVDYGLSGLVALSLVTLYLLFLAMRYWKRIYLLMAVFAIGSFVFLESVEYVFNEVLQPHQQMRIKVTLGMEEDLLGSGYHIGQSKIAIGSGAFFGKGYLNGTQTKLKYVPEQDTDFIFCTIGEEQGFIGASAVLILFLIFIMRLIFLAERQKSTFGRVYGYGVASVFIFHLIVNIGMVLGLTPVIGIPLPFFSYGGSSLWGFTILLFVFLRIDKSRKPF